MDIFINQLRASNVFSLYMEDSILKCIYLFSVYDNFEKCYNMCFSSCLTKEQNDTITKIGRLYITSHTSQDEEITVSIYEAFFWIECFIEIVNPAIITSCQCVEIDPLKWLPQGNYSRTLTSPRSAIYPSYSKQRENIRDSLTKEEWSLLEAAKESNISKRFRDFCSSCRNIHTDEKSYSDKHIKVNDPNIVGNTSLRSALKCEVPLSIDNIADILEDEHEKHKKECIYKRFTERAESMDLSDISLWLLVFFSIHLDGDFYTKVTDYIQDKTVIFTEAQTKNISKWRIDRVVNEGMINHLDPDVMTLVVVCHKF